MKHNKIIFSEEKNLLLQFLFCLHKLIPVNDCEDKTISVELYGFNTKSQLFLDSILQLLQLPGVNLDVTAFCRDEKDKEDYLSARPEIPAFFDIDGHTSDDSYGKISFIVNPDKCKSDDTLLYFSVNNDNKKLRLNDDKFIDEPEFEIVERMALNTHLIWNNFDVYNCHFDFYNNENYYLASFQYAISLKLKLQCLGVSIDIKSPGQSIALIKKIFKENKNNIVESLSYYEHRRWVVDKICSGYMHIEESDISYDCRENMNVTKRHICIAKSRPDSSIAGWSPEMLKNDSIDELDELDRHSVLYHRALVAHADFSRSSISDLINITFDESNSFLDFEKKLCVQDFLSCANIVMTQNTGKYRTMFAKSYKRLLKNLIPNDPIIHYANTINSFIKSLEPVDYKDYDNKMILKIPFILSYRTDINLVSEFSYGSVTNLYKNIAVIKKIKPAKINYYCICKDPNLFVNSYTKFTNYLREKFPKVAYKFIVLCSSNEIRLYDHPEITIFFDERQFFEKIRKLSDEENVSNIVFSDGEYQFAFGDNKTVVDSSTGEIIQSSTKILSSIDFPVSADINELITLSGAKVGKSKLHIIPDNFDNLHQIYLQNQGVWIFFSSQIKHYFEVNTTENRSNSNNVTLPLQVENNKLSRNRIFLSTLQEGNFIRNLEINSGTSVNGKTEVTYKFTFSSNIYRQLLSMEGIMLEYYSYYTCLKNGTFDDIAMSYEIVWENGQTQNEIDLVLVDKLNCIFVECKATGNLSQQYYEKMYYLRNEFGVNAYSVLVNDKITTLDTATLQNQSRGLMTNIPTLLISPNISEEYSIGSNLPEPVHKLYDILKIPSSSNPPSRNNPHSTATYNQRNNRYNNGRNNQR